MEKNINNRKDKQSTPQSHHYFASANSANGFDNLFDHINDPDKTGFMYILKGGPGTGKSTLMRTIANTFFELGEDIEYFYCSSDYKSLDGIRLSNRNIAIVDGTAPHVTEAKMPGVRDRIINLGEFISPSLKAHEKKIAALMSKKRAYYDIAYKYIKNAAILFESSNTVYSNQKFNLNIKSAAKKTISELELDKIIEPISNNSNLCFSPKKTNIVQNTAVKKSKSRKEASKVRRLYLTAVAEDGIVSLAQKNKYDKIIRLSYNDVINSQVLNAISKQLNESGNDIVCFCELLSPKQIGAIYVPKTNTLITKSEFSDIAEDEKNEFFAYLEFNRSQITKQLKQAALALAAAKKQHKKIESFYIPNMDFESIDKATAALIEEIKAAIG